MLWYYGGSSVGPVCPLGHNRPVGLAEIVWTVADVHEPRTNWCLANAEVQSIKLVESTTNGSSDKFGSAIISFGKGETRPEGEKHLRPDCYLP